MIIHPRVTIALYAFNEEKHIGEAIDSLIAQDYDDLEIILSDDNSSDLTFAIMTARASEYKGPHKLVLNRNPTNLGIGGQLNAICRLATGELIILAGGDDRSRPSRVADTVVEWIASGRQAHSIFSSACIIDSNGMQTGHRLARDVVVSSVADGVWRRFHGVYGASQAMSRAVYDAFGDFHPRLKLEDNAILLRAALLGGFRYLDRDLVDYRVHSGNSCRIDPNEATLEEWRRRVIWQHKETVLVNVQFLWDLHMPVAESLKDDERARSINNALYRALENQISLQHYRHEFRADMKTHLRHWLRIGVLLFKTAVKTFIPHIDLRNARRSLRDRARSAY